MRLLFLACLCFSVIFQTNGQNKNIPPQRPKLVVGIVVDQMRIDYLYRYWNKFENNGFKKLVNEGAFYKNAHLNYIFTQTGCGHATIFTGAEPSVHGIVSNYWYLRSKKQKLYCCEDKNVTPVGSDTKKGNRSPVNMLASTVGDELRVSTLMKGKVIGVSLKDRAAILPAGHTANAAYWYDSDSGNMITSSHYMKQLPKWVLDFNAKKLADVYLDRLWTPLLPIEQYTESLPDSNKFEYGFGNGQSVFPYDLAFISKKDKTSRNYEVLMDTPFGNTLTKDFAIATIMNEELGKDDIPDMLTVSFSSTDYMGHRYNPYSVEMEDVYLRLDKEIAHLIEFIETEVGKENVVIFLTADHGSSQHPDYMKSIKYPQGKFNPSYSMTLLKSYLNAVYGQGEWVMEYIDGQIYLNHNLIEDSKLSLKEVQEKTADFMIQFNGIANAMSAYSMVNTPFSDGIFKFMQNSFNQERSGDVFINLRPGWVEESSIYMVNHNTPYSYDTNVPLIFYGWKIPRQTVYQKVNITSIAPSISFMLNISTPNGCTSNILTNLFN
ncbi:MAG: alkaline phosphatase family protein [Bacteroidetes bacterium HGW-Bacteroidetes-21]|jgi:predicted AlkP superfamily pyrophosphatase or phosphodiesterase|nr:MAG: alkaline phosphatase family protein [Bacteroidetes bacterium HGW-Bacteroidetes-21]